VSTRACRRPPFPAPRARALLGQAPVACGEAARALNGQRGRWPLAGYTCQGCSHFSSSSLSTSSSNHHESTSSSMQYGCPDCCIDAVCSHHSRPFKMTLCVVLEASVAPCRPSSSQPSQVSDPLGRPGYAHAPSSGAAQAPRPAASSPCWCTRCAPISPSHRPSQPWKHIAPGLTPCTAHWPPWSQATAAPPFTPVP
jgi:hypothetical protein